MKTHGVGLSDRITYCPPHPFSNEIWTPGAIRLLKRYADSQTIPRENAAGFGIGSSGLPYLLGVLNISRFIVSDLHQNVIDSTLLRARAVARYPTWNAYARHIPTELGLTPIERDQLNIEVSNARRSGMLGSFVAMQAGANSIAVEGLCGDITQTAEELGQRLRVGGQVLTFVNLTNAAAYIDRISTAGRRILWDAVSSLPIADAAVVIDSSYSLTPGVYTAQEYANLAA